MKLSQSQADILGAIIGVCVVIAVILFSCGCNTPRMKNYIEPEPIGAYHNLTEADSIAIWEDISRQVWGWMDFLVANDTVPNTGEWEWIEIDDSVNLRIQTGTNAPSYYPPNIGQCLHEHYGCLVYGCQQDHSRCIKCGK